MKKLIYFILLLPGIIGAQNLIYSESFANCNMPAGYSVARAEGNYNFTIAKSSLFPRTDASCSIYYLQATPNDNTPRKFSISTGAFPLYSFSQHTVYFGLRFARTSSSNLHAYVIINGQKQLLKTWNSNVTDNTSIVVLQSFTVNTPVNASSLQLLFEYESPGGDVGTNILVDNIVIQGADNDDCNRAVAISLDAAHCLSGNITGAEYKGPLASCNGSYAQAVWYSFDAPVTGLVRLLTHATFNDAVTFFEGSCNALQQITCNNDDEFGFGGEKSFYQVQVGKRYYFRIAKQIDYYGSDVPDFCLELKKQDPAPPPHDLCSIKIPLELNKACEKKGNVQANFGNNIPSKNVRSRSDIWYSFTSTETTPLEIISNADFADVITVYSGTCTSLTEIQCEDLGGKLILQSPKVNTEYFIQLSGYFSTIEGNVCVQINNRSTSKPTNDDCPTARALTLNQSCTAISSLNANLSTKKPSCNIYSGPDIWYSFVASAEAKASLDIRAGFIYNYGVYYGSCNNLNEFTCGKAPDPCNGPIQLLGLVPGRTYYLQIIAVSQPLQPGEGEICVSVNEPSKTTPFTPLQLRLDVECLHGVLGKVNYTANGGTGQISYNGPASTDIFYPGAKIEAFIEDANGCRDFESTEVPCASPARCKNSNLDIQLETICLKDSIGRQTGEVLLNYTGKGGSGVYYQYGTVSGSTLKHGELYKLILIDSDSCYVIEEGRINCLPFDCSQSNLKCAVTYDCIDTLLKAQVKIDVTGALGAYTLGGTSQGSYLSQGEKYLVSVTDQAGCMSEVSGEIKCKFDSCAYSQASLEVLAECLKDVNGNLTGKAILKVTGNSKAGNIRYVGNQPGDTLKHEDVYSVQLVDGFGCGLTREGKVSCLVVNNNDQNHYEGAYVLPNPSTGNVWLNFWANEANEFLIQTYSANGKLMSEQKFRFNVGKQQIILPDNNKPSGIYYVKIKSKNQQDLLRFIKL